MVKFFHVKLRHILEQFSVIINYPRNFTELGVPFGGMRKSELGRIYGKYGIMPMGQLKSVIWNFG